MLRPKARPKRFIIGVTSFFIKAILITLEVNASSSALPRPRTKAPHREVFGPRSSGVRLLRPVISLPARTVERARGAAPRGSEKAALMRPRSVYTHIANSVVITGDGKKEDETIPPERRLVSIYHGILCI